MIRLVYRRAIQCSMIPAILICVATSVFGQPPQQASETKPTVSADSPQAVDDDLKQGSHRSLMLSRRQSVIQCMDLIREAFARKDYLGALPLMERIRNEPNSFVPVDSTFEVAAHEEVRRLVSQMPAELRKRLDDQRMALATKEWELVRTSTKNEWISFVHRYFDLPIAIEAWWTLGLCERDHGRRRLAAAAFLKIADLPQANGPQRLLSLVSAHEMLRDEGALAEADQIRRRLAEIDENIEIPLPLQSIRLSQWLKDHPLSRSFQNQPPASLSANAIQARSRQPVAVHIWKEKFSVAVGANMAIQEQKQRDLGVKPIPLLRPLIVSSRVVTRNLDSIYVYSLTNGVAQWIQPNTEYRDLEGLGIFDRVANQNAVTDWVQRRTEADSIFGRMSTDGTRLFVVQEPDRMREFGLERQSLRGGFRSGPRFNKLSAYSLIDGAVQWEIGGSPDANSEYRGDFFLGCPFVLDGELYAVVQRETEVQLLAIRPEDGSLIWNLTLGDVLLPVTEDLQRSRVACPIIWNDGLLLVSTGAGAVVAVDPVLRSFCWGYRYQAKTISSGDLFQGQNPADVHQVQESWWDRWREPFLQAASLTTAVPPDDKRSGDAGRPSMLVFASPETEQIHAIRLPAGESAWKEPRNGGLMVAGIDGNQVIIIEGDFARAHDLQTGRQTWRTATAEISGPATLSGSTLILPLLSGGAMLLDAQSGQIIADATSSESPLGTLAETDRGWIACNRQSIMLLPRLSDVRDEVNRELAASPDDESLRVRASFLDLQAGDFESARGRLEGLQSSPARDLRRQALIDALRDIGTPRTTSQRSELERQLKELALGADYKFAAAMAIGSSAITVSDFPAAVEAALDGLSTNLDLSEGLVKNDATLVRKDRILLGLIDEVFRRVKPPDRAALDQLFQARLAKAQKSKDRQAVERLSRLWRGLDWSRRLVVTEEEKSLRGLSLQEAELRLLDAAGSADPDIAYRALQKLALRFERHHAERDVWAIYQRLRTEFPSGGEVNDSTGTERSSPLKRDDGLNMRHPGPAWPATDPRWEVLDDRHFNVYSPIQMHAEPGSLAERLDVWIRREGDEILFRGESFFQVGQDEKDERKISLLTSSSAYRGQSGYMLREGWGIGRIVILLVGSELVAITPLSEEGEPDSKFLWSNPIELGPPPVNSKVLTGRPHINDGYEFLVDQSNRQIGKVGPVRAGYFCYQKGTRLIAADTETGYTLWERLDLPADASLLGDDHFVYVWRDGGSLELFSAIDGRRIEQRVTDLSPTKMFHQRGSLVWTANRGTDLRIELHDLRTGQLVWSRDHPKESRVAAMDADTIAIITPEPMLHLLNARSGRAISQPLTLNGDSFGGRIVTWHDSERWFLALGAAAEGITSIDRSQGYASYRKAVISGRLYGIDRWNPRILWQRELKEELLALDQSRVAPAIVQLWKKIIPGNPSGAEFIMKITDSRTGKVLPIKPQKADSPYFLLNPDSQQAILEVRLTRDTIRIQYGKPDGPNASGTEPRKD